MTELEYLAHAEVALKAVELACDRINAETDADIDKERTGGLITLSFANRSQISIILIKPSQVIWLVAKAGGFHYKFHANQWCDTKDSSEFFAALSRYASEQSGRALLFSS